MSKELFEKHSWLPHFTKEANMEKETHPDAETPIMTEDNFIAAISEIPYVSIAPAMYKFLKDFSNLPESITPTELYGWKMEANKIIKGVE